MTTVIVALCLLEPCVDNCDCGIVSTRAMCDNCDCGIVSTRAMCDNCDCGIVSTRVMCDNCDCGIVSTRVMCDDCDCGIVSTGVMCDNCDCSIVSTPVMCDNCDCGIVSTGVMCDNCDCGTVPTWVLRERHTALTLNRHCVFGHSCPVISSTLSSLMPESHRGTLYVSCSWREYSGSVYTVHKRSMSVLELRGFQPFKALHGDKVNSNMQRSFTTVLGPRQQVFSGPYVGVDTV